MNNSFLLVTAWDGGELSATDKSASQIIDFIDMSDCYPVEVTYRVYYIAGVDHLIPLHSKGWQPGNRITLVDDDGTVYIDDYGTDH